MSAAAWLIRRNKIYYHAGSRLYIARSSAHVTAFLSRPLQARVLFIARPQSTMLDIMAVSTRYGGGFLISLGSKVGHFVVASVAQISFDDTASLGCGVIRRPPGA